MKALTARERAVYDLLQDDKSRDIFLTRKKFADAGYMLDTTDTDMFCEFYEKPNGFDEMIRVLADSPYVIYGAGYRSRQVIKALKIMNKLRNCTAIWDNNKNLHGQYIEMIPIMPPSNKYVGVQTVLVGLSEKNTVFSEVIECLLNLGFDDTQIIQPYYLFLNANQYFDDKIILSRLIKDEVFVDGGSWDFGDGKKILRYAPSVKKIYAFEPDENLFERVLFGITESGFNNVQFEKCAMWSEDATLYFESNIASGGSSIRNHQTNVSIIARSLDNIVPDHEAVTFIKMDVEGAEIEALKGCSRIICRDKPKLAICVYHKPYDYLECSEYILSLVPEYKLFMRHYRISDNETVLYAVI